MHRIAATPGEAGALRPGGGHRRRAARTCAATPSRSRSSCGAGAVPEALVDRAARRVLRQKGELGLLDADWSPESPAMAAGRLDLDPPEGRALARELAEASIVLLDNDGTLPLRRRRPHRARRALRRRPAAVPRLLLVPQPRRAGAATRTWGSASRCRRCSTALEAELPDATVVREQGCPIMERGRVRPRSGRARPRAAPTSASPWSATAPGLFGRGTSGEGCDAEDLSLPGIQDELVEAVLATGTPVVLVVVSGRPYALGRYAGRLAATVQAFLPGEEGGAALAGVLSGRVDAVGQAARADPAQPRRRSRAPTCNPPLGGNSEGVSNIDPTPAFPFGHGLSYTTFDVRGLRRRTPTRSPTDGEVEVSCVVRNTGDRAGAEVVQLYLADPVAQVTRPVTQLAGFARVALEPGAQARVAFRLHADRTSFTGRRPAARRRAGRDRADDRRLQPRTSGGAERCSSRARSGSSGTTAR